MFFNFTIFTIYIKFDGVSEQWSFGLLICATCLLLFRKLGPFASFGLEPPNFRQLPLFVPRRPCHQIKWCINSFYLLLLLSSTFVFWGANQMKMCFLHYLSFPLFLFHSEVMESYSTNFHRISFWFELFPDHKSIFTVLPCLTTFHFAFRWMKCNHLSY